MFKPDDRVRVKASARQGRVIRAYKGDTYSVMLDGDTMASIFAASEIEHVE